MTERETHNETEEELTQLIRFSVGEEEYGLDVANVKEVIRTSITTRLPKAPDFLKGIINLRGDIIPIIDLRERFGLGTCESTESTRVIVVDVGSRLIGTVVDAVSQVVRITASQVEPTQSIAAGLCPQFIQGVARIEERLVILLSTDSVLSGTELVELDRVGDYSKDPERVGTVG